MKCINDRNCVYSVPAHFRSRTVNQSGVAGEGVILICEAEGDLPLRVIWGISPRLHVPPAHSRHTPTGLASEIHLNNLSRRDAGVYHCTAQNEFGEDNMVVYLTVRGKIALSMGVSLYVVCVYYLVSLNNQQIYLTSHLVKQSFTTIFL